jgi:hypothetical protein
MLFLRACLSHLVKELPKTAERDPKKTIFLWTVNIEPIFSALMSSFYFTWCNLKSRLLLEQNKEERLIAKVERYGTISSEHFTQGEIERWKKYELAIERLENSLLKLDDSILLFRDFN